MYGMLKLISILLAIYIAIWSYAPVGTFGTTGGFVTRKDSSAWPAWLDQSGLHLPGYIIDEKSEERNKRGVILTPGSVSGPLAWWNPSEKGSERAIVADDTLQMICLGITRISAFFMYPSLILVFTTKFRATIELLFSSPLSLLSYSNAHELHVFCGKVVVFDGILHTVFHIVRWADQGNLYLVFNHRSGISGFVAVISILLISVPMMFEVLRSRIKYEVRKYVHYFFVIFCIAMSFHAPLSTIPNGGFTLIVFPTLIIWWALDNLYVYLYLTEKIETSKFHVTPNGAQLTMTVSEDFQKRGNSGGYCYVNFPWITKNQWHAFSLFENPLNPSERQIYMQDLGDWTHKVLLALQRDTHRPVWVMGPFSSPYDSAADVDNQILVAAGIGITPALSVLRKHVNSRRSNLIWAVRDPHMLEFFVKHGAFSTRGWNLVFYTGNNPLYVGDTKEVVTKSGALVHIIRCRPNLDDLIPNIIYSIESGKFFPEAFVSEAKSIAIGKLKTKLAELDDMEITSREKMVRLNKFTDELGFLFTDLMGEIFKDDKNLHKKMEKLRGSFEEDGSKENHKNDDAQETNSPEKGETEVLTAIRSRKQFHRRRSSAWSFFGGSVVDSMEAGSNVFMPWADSSKEPREFVSRLNQDVLSTWGCLYCGGQGPLANSLKKVTKEFGVSIALESFKW